MFYVNNLARIKQTSGYEISFYISGWVLFVTLFFRFDLTPFVVLVLDKTVDGRGQIFQPCLQHLEEPLRRWDRDCVNQAPCVLLSAFLELSQFLLNRTDDVVLEFPDDLLEEFGSSDQTTTNIVPFIGSVLFTHELPFVVFFLFVQAFHLVLGLPLDISSALVEGKDSVTRLAEIVMGEF